MTRPYSVMAYRRMLYATTTAVAKRATETSA